MTDTMPSYVVPLTPEEESVPAIEYNPTDDVTERFRSLRSETGGEYSSALTLLDVARLRNATYRTTVDILRARDAEVSAERDALLARVAAVELERDEARLNLQNERTFPIRLDDPRLEAEWERAGEIATEENFCSEYDRMCERLGIPGREREWEVCMTVTLEPIHVHTTVTARSMEAAQEAIEEDYDIIRDDVQSAYESGGGIESVSFG